MRTRVKFCGFTREQDIQAAVQLGADALGFIFYPPSPRYVTPQVVAAWICEIPAFVTTVGLFVNESLESIQKMLKVAPVSTIQLHGDESWSFAQKVMEITQKPVIKAVRINPQTDWNEVTRNAHQVTGLLLDADVTGYGGAGHTFDWSVIPHELRHKIILSGGLNLENVVDAIKTIRPYALDVSSGIESGIKGVKSTEKMAMFMDRVKNTEA